MDVLDLNEFTFRFTRRFYPFSAFRSLLGIAGGAESPTFAELYPANGRTLHVVGVCVNRIGTLYCIGFARILIDSMVKFCRSEFGRGPFLFTYARPASVLDRIPPPLLFVDLSEVGEEAFLEYIAAYKTQVKSDDINDGSKIDTMRLKILRLLVAGKGLLVPIEKAIAYVIHVSETANVK